MFIKYKYKEEFFHRERENRDCIKTKNLSLIFVHNFKGILHAITLFIFFCATLLTAPVCNLPFPIIGLVFAVQR